MSPVEDHREKPPVRPTVDRRSLISMKLSKHRITESYKGTNQPEQNAATPAKKLTPGGAEITPSSTVDRGQCG